MATYIEKEKIGLTDFEIIMCEGNYKQALELLLDKIENIPAADVKPVVYGKWIGITATKPYMKCSICGKSCHANIENLEVKFWDYCPNCGAKMKK